MRSKRSKAICTYCDAIAKTSDHVPPKLLFDKPRPELITVPSCLRCNQKASKDDEYFRLALALERTAGDHPEAVKVRDKVLRSLQKPKKKGMRRAFLDTVQFGPMVSPSGIYTGQGASYNVSLERLDNVITRITRGLFLECEGRRLPIDCDVTSYSSRGLLDAGPGLARELLNVLDYVSDSRVFGVGGDTFRWKYMLANDRQNSSFWVFSVYGAVTFVAFTIDPNKVSKDENVA